MFDQFFQGDALWFSVPALLGTAVFALRLGLMMLGGDHGDGGDGHFGDSGDTGDVSLDGHGADGHDSDSAFAILSVQTVSVFMMGFGWCGLGCLFGARWPVGVALGLGFLTGVAMVWILTRTLGAVRELESSGNVPIGSALGLEGDVYARIPPAGEGRGQVKLIIDQRQRIYNAISRTGEVTSQTRVRVVNVNDDNTLTVEPV